MLARTIAWICVWWILGGYCFAEDDGNKPHVILLLEGEYKGELNESTAHGLLDMEFLASAGAQDSPWKAYQGRCVVSPGKAATVSALLHGQPPLLNGVVSDRGWRRKPTTGMTLADAFQNAGYRTGYYGAWGTGLDESLGFSKRISFGAGKQDTLDDIWHRGDSKADYARPMLVDISQSLNKGKPLFCMIQKGRRLSDSALAGLMKIVLLPHAKKNKRPIVFVIIRDGQWKDGGKRGVVPDRFHYPANWYLYYHGSHAGFMASLKHFKPAKTDWELHAGLINMLGGAEQEVAGYRIFHKANWPSNESPDKYRHRGSLVIGKGHALVDGLELYPATKNLEPDLTKSLDIAKHQEIHSDLLMAHSRWWQKARKALHDPRAFLVGVEDENPIRLTAMDWRASKIIHTDGTIPSSKPVIYQEDLLAMLAGLKEEKYRQSFPAYSGSWSVDVKRAGRYKITASLLPKEATKPEEKTLAKLLGGQAFFRLGRNKVQLNLLKGASFVSVLVDADAGVTDLECWFTGQLALERELGAFFVEIQRVGDKKFDLKAKEQ